MSTRLADNCIMITDEHQRVSPAFGSDGIVLGLFSSDMYAPYCGTLIQSVLCQSRSENNYDILILERDISERNKKNILSLIEGRSNFSIRFVNLSSMASLLKVTPRAHFTLDNALKVFLLSPYFEQYDKIVSTDSDLVFERDLAELWNTDLEGLWMAATEDIIMKYLLHINAMCITEYGPMPYKQYITRYLGRPAPENYLNTGVIVLNTKQCRKDNLYEKVIDALSRKKYYFLEQDALNEVLGPKAILVNPRWNVLTGNGNMEKIKDNLAEDLAKEYVDCLENCYIMHYAGPLKPWHDPTVVEAEHYFKYARMTSWYEQILASIYERKVEEKLSSLASAVRPPKIKSLEGITLKNVTIVRSKIVNASISKSSISNPRLRGLQLGIRDILRPFYRRLVKRRGNPVQK